MAKKKSTEAPAGRKPASQQIEKADADGFVDVQSAGGDPRKMQVADKGLTVGAGAKALEDLLDMEEVADGEPGNTLEFDSPEDLDVIRDRVKEMNELSGEEVDEGDSEDGEGDDSDDSEGDDLARLVLDEATLDSTVTVKVDGEELEVPLREALAGHQRHRAFTQKTQELAVLRRDTTATRDSHAHAIEMIVTGLGRSLDVGQQQALAANYERILQERAAIQKEDLQTIVAAEQESLVEAMGWTDADEAEVKTAKAELREYASDLGFEDSALSGVTDHRLLVMLDKARRYDALKEKGADLREKARKGKKTPTLQPGGVDLPSSSKSTRDAKALKAAKKRLSATGSVSDAASVMEALLD